MFRSTTIRRYMIFLFLAAFVAGQMILTGEVQAGWDDRSDELPGYSDGEFLKKAVIVVGVTVGVLLILKAANKKKDETKKEEETKPQEESAQSEVLQGLLFNDSKPQLALQPPRLMPCLGVVPKTAGGGGPALMAGFAYSF